MNIDPLNPTELLRWWHRQQAQMLNREADLIRNQLLQDMFSIRRCLELSCETQPNAAAFGCETHLAELARMYTQLESLGNRLEAPYLQDSLPLALQYAVEPWQEQVHIKIGLPNRWDHEPVEHTRLLVLLAETLLQQLANVMPLPCQCDLILQRQDEMKELTFRSNYRESLPPSLIAERFNSLTPILETFQLLTQGTYEHDIQKRSLTWVLRWPPSNVAIS